MEVLTEKHAPLTVGGRQCDHSSTDGYTPPGPCCPSGPGTSQRQPRRGAPPPADQARLLGIDVSAIAATAKPTARLARPRANRGAGERLGARVPHPVPSVGVRPLRPAGRSGQPPAGAGPSCRPGRRARPEAGRPPPSSPSVTAEASAPGNGSSPRPAGSADPPPVT